MALGFTQPLTEMSTRKCFWGVERGRRARLITSPPSVSRLSRKCVILDISQLYRAALPVTGINLIPPFQKPVKIEVKPHLSSVCTEKLVNCSKGFDVIDNLEI
jgi:hypothetical protein